MKQKKLVVFQKQYLRRLLLLAVPIMLSNVIAQLQMLIDRVFLGNVNTLNMSALGNVTSPMWTTMSFCFSLATGASILISQAVGADNREKIGTYAGALVKWNNVIPILLFLFWLFCSEPVFRLMGVSDNLMPLCLDYAHYYSPVFLITGIGSSLMVIMQTSNYTQPLIFYGLLRSGLNVFLDWVLIFGKFGLDPMGIKGAAIATTIAEFTGGIFLLCIFVSSKKLPTRPKLSEIVHAKAAPFLYSAKLGVNTALEDFAWNFGNLLLLRILNTINELAAGIYNIIFSVEVLVVVVIGSIGNGTMTIASEAKGKKDLKQYKGVCLCAYGLCVIVGLVTLVICLIFPDQIIGMFTKDKAIIASSGIYLIFISLNLFSKSANIIVGNGIRGSGNTKWMFYTQIFGTVFVVGVAALFVFVFDFGIAGVFLAVIFDELVRALINFSKLVRICKGWETQ